MIDRMLKAIGDERLNGSESVAVVQFGDAKSAVLVPEPMEAPEIVAAVERSMLLSHTAEVGVFDRALDVLLEALRELASNPDEWARYRTARRSLEQKGKA